MTSLRSGVKLSLMKKLTLYIFLVLMFSVFTSHSIAWKKVPVPDYVDKKTKSPWNFYENFEEEKIGKVKLNKFDINDKGKGKKPFKIKQDADGNKFLEITVKHGWNKGKYYKTERAEFQTKGKRALNREIWYGFKLRLPKDFKHIDDRVLINQFKNNFDNMKKSPLIGIRFYSDGELLDLGGDTGGIATKKWNKEEDKKHGLRVKYIKNNESWNLIETKIRGEDKKKLWKCNISKNMKAYDITSLNLPEFCKDINIEKTLNVTELDNWTTFKVGIKNSKKKDGFVKVFKDDKLIMNYNGITFDWKGSYYASYIRVGIYRDSDPSGKGYPDQIVHFDDFTVVSDKKTLDKYLK